MSTKGDGASRESGLGIPFAGKFSRSEGPAMLGRKHKGVARISTCGKSVQDAPLIYGVRALGDRALLLSGLSVDGGVPQWSTLRCAWMRARKDGDSYWGRRSNWTGSLYERILWAS